MEIPYAGRAIIEDGYNETIITVPTKKNWFIILFLGFWLTMWAVGFIVATFTMPGAAGPGAPFLLLWLCMWTAGGFFAARTFFWNLIGKEVITAGNNVLNIEKKGVLLFVKPKTYDLNEAKLFRVREEEFPLGAFSPFGLIGARRGNIFSLGGGTIRFDYGLETIRFGGGLSEAEGRHILTKLTDKKILTEKNF